MNKHDHDELTTESLSSLDEAHELLTDLIMEVSGRCMEDDAWQDAEPLVRQIGNLHLTLEHVTTARNATRVTRGDFGRDVA